MPRRRALPARVCSLVAWVALAAATCLGCAAEATAAGNASPQPDPAPTSPSSGTGSDVGNGRPVVTHDGLMVRRLAVIALRVAPGTDLAAERSGLARAARLVGTSVTEVSTSVLDAAVLEDLRPDLVVALPSGATVSLARLVAESALGSPVVDQVEEYRVDLVLVHDLRFRLRTPHPEALALAVAREGILSDALGNYATRASPGLLEVDYTGPLLSDHLVQLVREALGRPTHQSASAVTLGPRSPRGQGVDLASEPPPAPDPPQPPPTATHDHAARLIAAGTAQPTGIRGAESRALLLIIALGLILVLLRRRDGPDLRSNGVRARTRRNRPSR